jgi:hypothetical protein
MTRSAKLTDGLAILTGAFLLIAGIWGLTSTTVFGVFTTNTTHAAIHLVLGVIGIVTGIRHRANGFCVFLSILLGLIGIVYFIPAGGTYVRQYLNVNAAVAYFNIVLAIVLAIVVAIGRQSRKGR